MNTYIGRKIHRATGRSVLPLGTGGLSGPAIQPLALAAVAAVCEAVHIPVIGVGGIVDAASAQDFLTVGARAVQVGTATFVNPRDRLAGARRSRGLRQRLRSALRLPPARAPTPGRRDH